MKRQYNYSVQVSFYENDDMTQLKAVKVGVRASDTERALLAARKWVQIHLSKKGIDIAFENLNAKVL